MFYWGTPHWDKITGLFHIRTYIQKGGINESLERGCGLGYKNKTILGLTGKEMKNMNKQNEKRVKSYKIKINLFIFTGVSVLNGKTYIYNYNDHK